MKYILITLIVISCTSKPTEVANIKQDTTIHQKVVFEGQYVLYTYVQTDIKQDAFSQKTYYYAPIYFYPYSTIIKGSFEYIKSNKQTEYLKAMFFVDTLKKIANFNTTVTDSVEYLNKMRN